MNKKFTFMVAALLAAGSVFATPVEVPDFAKAPKGYYHLKIGSQDFLSMTENAADGAITFGSDATPSGDEYLWEVSVNSKKEVTLKNKKTGRLLAVKTGDSPALVTEAILYTNGTSLDTTFDLVNGELRYNDSYEFGFKDSEYKLVDDDKVGGSETNTAKLYYVENTAGDADDVESLANLGEGIDLTFEGTPTGVDVFQGVTVVQIASSDKFYLVKGKVNSDMKKNTYVVLSSNSLITGVAAPDGLQYTTVSGDKIATINSDITSADYKKGQYPVENARFSVKFNVNKAGKIVLTQANDVKIVVNDAWGAPTSAKPVFVSATGNNGALLVNAQTTESNAAWLTPSLGTAVDVKSLVKGQWIVNILASEDKESTTMKRVVYSSQQPTSTVVISSSTENTNKHKDAVYAQWVVSADENANTVTFINRETGKTISGVTLFKTPKANVYTTTSAALTSDAENATPNGVNLNSCFIELRTVENTTQFDGYLNLDKDGLDSEYTLSVEAGDKFADYEVPVVVKDLDFEKGKYSVLTPAENKDEENVFTFKLAQSKDANSKLDTVVVNALTYGYYKDGKFTTAKDTLKAISYNFASLKNAGKNYKNDTKDNSIVDANFNLWNSEETGKTVGKFVFRKVGEQYQIATGVSYASGIVYLTEDANDFYSYSDVTKAQAFSLNPVAVAPSYDVPESHIALQINGAYLGSKADGNAIMTNDTSMLKSTVADAAFSFYAFSADKEEAKTPSYYLSSNGKMMNDAKAEVDAINEELAGLSEVFDAEKIAELKAELATYYKDGDVNQAGLVKFQQAKYVDAEHIALANDTVEGDALKSYKFNVLDVDGQAVLKNGNGKYVTVLNDAVVLQDNIDNAAKFDVVAAEAPTSNERVSATEVKVVAQNGSVVVKNAAGKNVVVSTILGQVVANEVLTSDNATINVPAGIVVVAVEGESFKVNVK